MEHAKQRETEAKQRETEAKQRETEAKQRESEAKQREKAMQLQLAEYMLKTGVPVVEIAQRTGLTITEIEALS